jgi:hypothetical protein
MWETLVRAISQRFNSCFDFQTDDRIAEQLFDRFEKQAFTCFINDKDASMGWRKPIIYYEKRYHITRFLFSSTPLIGIPLDMVDSHPPTEKAQAISQILGSAAAESPAEPSFTSKNDAIAHELGHYFFWNSGRLTEYYQRMEMLQQEIARVVLKDLAVQNGKAQAIDILKEQNAFSTRFAILTTWLHWVDELFADIVGTLLRGPAYVLSAQDLQAERVDAANDLLADDGEHPIPALRPLIGLEVLRYIRRQSKKKSFVQAIDKTIAALEQRWQTYLEAMQPDSPQPGSSSGNYHHSEFGAAPTLQELQAYLAPIVQIILTTPLTYLPDSADTCPLVQCLRYWGAEETEEERSELKAVQEAASLQENELVESFVPRKQDTASAAGVEILQAGGEEAQKLIPQPPAVNKDSPLFDLVEYIKQKRERIRTANQTLSHEEWEELLKLDLVINLGHSPGMGGGDGYSDHIHTNPSLEHKHFQSGYIAARYKKDDD